MKTKQFAYMDGRNCIVVYSNSRKEATAFFKSKYPNCKSKDVYLWCN